MNVIETAKIIAASTQLRPCIPLRSSSAPFPEDPNGVDRLANGLFSPDSSAGVTGRHWDDAAPIDAIICSSAAWSGPTKGVAARAASREASMRSSDAPDAAGR